MSDADFNQWASQLDAGQPVDAGCGQGHVPIPDGLPNPIALGAPTLWDTDTGVVAEAVTGMFVWNGRSAWVLVHWCPGCQAHVRDF